MAKPGGENIQKREFPKKDQVRINERIRIPQIRLIDENGGQVGLIETFKALEMARSRALDLVEVAPTARPPVCRIMDYGKFKYEQTKKAKQSKKKQHQVKVKEEQFRPHIDDHDYNFKKKHIIDFIEHDYKVKVQIVYRGREIMHQELGKIVLNRLIGDLKEVAELESPPRLEGKQLVCTFVPGKKKEIKKKDGAESEVGSE